MDKNCKFLGFYGVERSNQRHYTTKVKNGAGKETILLIHEYNVSHSSWSHQKTYANPIFCPPETQPIRKIKMGIKRVIYQ